MPVALAVGGGGRAVTAVALVARLRALDVRLAFVRLPAKGARTWRAELEAGGVTTCGVGVGGASRSTDDDLARAVHVASALRAKAVVVEGGAGPDDAGEAGRAAAVEALARRLHGPLAAGAPLAVRPADTKDALLDGQALEWLLGALPHLGVWLDPTRVLRRARDGATETPGDHVQAWVPRATGVFVHGLGSSGGGGAHPEDDGPDWGTLAGALPRRVPWVLDLGDALGEDDVKDALAWARHVGEGRR